MKHLAKILCLGAAFIAAPLAHATPITGTIGFNGNGTYTVATGQFTAGPSLPSGLGNAQVNTVTTGSLSMFTYDNPANFLSFNTSVIPVGGEQVFTTTEVVSGVSTTLTFKLTSFAANGTDPAGPGFTGAGILSESGFTDTAASFSLNTNPGAGTFITFNTAATTAVTPEPSSLVLLGSGLLSAAGMVARRRRV